MKVFETKKILTNPNVISRVQTIKAENIAKATYFLRDKIYTYKDKAAFCETLCNAIDEHNKHEIIRPVDIIITGSEICIRDYAVGLSDNDVLDIFFQYFESTKSHDNIAIGGFGIGAKAPGAYNNLYYVESYYNGKRNVFVSTVDGYESRAIKIYSENCSPDNTGICVRIPYVQVSDKNDFCTLAKDMYVQVGFYSKKEEDIAIYKISDNIDYNQWVNKIDNKAQYKQDMSDVIRLKDFKEKNESFDEESQIIYMDDNSFEQKLICNYSHFRLFNKKGSFFRETFYAYDGDMLYRIPELKDSIIANSGIDLYKCPSLIFLFKRGELPILPNRESIEDNDFVQKWLGKKLAIFAKNIRNKVIKRANEEYRNNVPLICIQKLINYYDKLNRFLSDPVSIEVVEELDVSEPYSLDSESLSGFTFHSYSNKLSSKTKISNLFNYFVFRGKTKAVQFLFTKDKKITQKSFAAAVSKKFNKNYKDFSTGSDHDFIYIHINNEEGKFYKAVKNGKVYCQIYGENMIYPYRRGIDYIFPSDLGEYEPKPSYNISKSYFKRSRVTTRKTILVDYLYNFQIAESEYKNTLILCQDDIEELKNNHPYLYMFFKMKDEDFANNITSASNLIKFLEIFFDIKHIAKMSSSLANYYVTKYKAKRCSDLTKEHFIEKMFEYDFLYMQNDSYTILSDIFSNYPMTYYNDCFIAEIANKKYVYCIVNAQKQFITKQFKLDNGEVIDVDLRDFDKLFRKFYVFDRFFNIFVKRVSMAISSCLMEKFEEFYTEEEINTVINYFACRNAYGYSDLGSHIISDFTEKMSKFQNNLKTKTKNIFKNFFNKNNFNYNDFKEIIKKSVLEQSKIK